MGPETERVLGRVSFLIVYFLSGILGGLGWVLIGSQGLCVGASGAIFGLLGAFATMFPHRRITLLLFFIIPITMKAWMLVSSLALMELLLLLSREGGGIAYAVHLGGIMVGVIYVWILSGKAEQWRRRGPRLRVVRGGRLPMSEPHVEIDSILDKISRKGIESLTTREREQLMQASQER